MAFKMRGWSAFKKDIIMYDGGGEKVTVDDANLGDIYRDENGNEARDYTLPKKGTDVLYVKPPRGPSEWEDKKPIQKSPDPSVGFGEKPNLA